jgi:serine/threonine-protein kinase
VVHRDIKPSNVRLTPEGEVKVLDFGIARADFSGREAKTGRVRYGSIGYMSPERLLGEPEVPEGDVFAVGCVLFELITGTALGRVELGPDQQVEQVKEARSKLVAALEEGGAGAVSEELGGLLEETLAYKPEGRPKAAHVADRLRRAGRKLEGEDLVAFAQRFVVQVADLIDDQTRPARGSFLEEGTLAESLDEDKTNPTLVFDVVGLPTGTGTFGFEPEDLGLPDDTPAQTEGVPSAEVATPPPEEEEPSRMGMFIALGVAAVLVVGGGVWAMQSMQQGAETGPTVVAPAEPVTEPAVEPVDEPAVVAEPVAEPVDEPVVVEVDPAEEKAPTVAPATQPARVKARPPPPVPVPVVEPAPETTGEVTLLRSVKFAVAGASSVSASCGGVTGQGATSALLRQVPAGSCSVSAVVDGTSLSGTVVVDKPRGVDCTVEGGALSCR